MDESLNRWLKNGIIAFDEDTFLKFTLSQPAVKSDLLNVYGKRILIKGADHISLTFHYKTRDQVKNFPIIDFKEYMADWLGKVFHHGDLFTTENVWTYKKNKKGESVLLKSKSAGIKPTSKEHDKPKNYHLSPEESLWMQDLGLSSKENKVLSTAQDKWRQINKYVEVIQHLTNERPLPKGAKIVDMGSGSGYLTFGLYQLLHQIDPTIQVIGYELKPELVEKCNAIATKYEYKGLKFVEGNIAAFEGKIEKPNMLVALHACDTLTDLAIKSGLDAEAEIIVTAPCCHKQIRKSMRATADVKPMLKHGILFERQAEMLTDAIRGLLLEREGYKVKIFEFISVEHTPKNVIITAIKDQKNLEAQSQIETLRNSFGVRFHFLEKLLS
jgi:SAM-dependent methyltransferase